MPYDIIIGRDESDKKRFEEKGLIYLGKGFVKMGNYSPLSNKIFLDISRSHVVLVAGKRGSGKSYSLSVIAEELSTIKDEEIKNNIASLVFDTMGIFWTMKYKNEKEKELLADWELKPQNVPVRVFVPFAHFEEYQNNNIPVDEKFALKPDELEIEDWLITFNLSITNPVSVLIQKTLSQLKEKGSFNIVDIINALQEDKTSENDAKNAAINLFSAADSWGIFSTQGTPVSNLIKPGTTTILDLSVYNAIGIFNIRALVIGLICRNLFKERMKERKKEEVEAIRHGSDYLSFKQKRDFPLVWLFIDEVHEFVSKGEKTAATEALIQLLREGRQPGISLVMATQQPGVLHNDVLTQSDVVISHRVTAEPDISALNLMMQSYLFDSIKKYLDDLPNLKGSAIILDDNSERIYPMRVRPKFTWHGGEAPTSIKIKKRF